MTDQYWNAVVQQQTSIREGEMRRFHIALMQARATGFVGLTLPSVEARYQQDDIADLQPPLEVYDYWPTKEALAFTYLELAMRASFLRANAAYNEATGDDDDDGHPDKVPDTKNFRWYVELYAHAFCRYLSYEREFVWEALSAAFLRMPLYGVRLESLRGVADTVFLHEDDFPFDPQHPEPKSFVGYARSRSLIEDPQPTVFDPIRLTLWSYAWAVLLMWHADTTPKSQATQEFIAQTARVPATAVQCHWMYDLTDLEPYLIKALWKPLETQLGGVQMPTSARRILDILLKPAGGGTGKWLAGIPMTKVGVPGGGGGGGGGDSEPME